MVSLASLNAVQASETPYEFEYIDQDGTSTGVFFSVLGDQSEKVRSEVARLINDRRRKEAAQALRQSTGGRKAAAEFVPIEEDLEFAQRVTAVRLVGWRGIDEEFTPALGLALVRSNPHIADAITEASRDLSNFTKASPTS